MTRKTVLTDDDRLAIVDLYGNGAGVVELARKFHCRTSTINATLLAAGVVRLILTANTPIERRLHDALRAAGIGFSTQCRLVGRYVVDIQLHQQPVIIEADGMRHHATAEARARDAKRDAEHEDAGFRVFRFTGSQINLDASACIQQVIDACGLVADKEPVYEIRTKPDALHPIPWKDRIGVLACEHCGGTFEVQNERQRRFCSWTCVGLHHRETGIKKGIPKSAEHRARIADGNRRRVWTDESRAKLSASRSGQPSPNKGKPVPADVRAKISATLTGHRDNDETRAKKSASHLGKKRDPAIGAKIAASLRGKPKSAEHRAALSAARRRRSQIKIESDLRGDAQRPAEMTGPATAGSE